MFRTWLLRASRLQLTGAAICFAVLVFLSDVGLDFLMFYFDSTRRELMLISDFITALLAGLLMAWVLLIQRTRQLEMQERMQVISDMNHHVRNALQVISYWGVHETSREQLGYIRESVERIEWALSDVLPRGVPHRGIPARPAPRIERQRASND